MATPPDLYLVIYIREHRLWDGGGWWGETESADGEKEERGRVRLVGWWMGRKRVKGGGVHNGRKRGEMETVRRCEREGRGGARKYQFGL